MTNLKILKSLCTSNGISGDEKKIRDIILSEISEFVDEYKIDNLGNIIAFKKGKNRAKSKLLISAHMDEVGFMVQHISPDGYIYVIPIGNVDNRAKSYQKVVITTQQNESYIGLLQTSHDRLYIDIGVDSSQEIIDRHIAIGDMVTFASETCQLNDNRMMAKAVDDRIGCFICKPLRI